MDPVALAPSDSPAPFVGPRSRGAGESDDVSEFRSLGEALARRTRKAQGLPKTIRDPETIRRVVALLVRDGYQGNQDRGAA